MAVALAYLGSYTSGRPNLSVYDFHLEHVILNQTGSGHHLLGTSLKGSEHIGR